MGPFHTCASRPSPGLKTDAQRLAAAPPLRVVLRCKVAVTDSNRLEFGLHQKREIKRLVELLIPCAIHRKRASALLIEVANCEKSRRGTPTRKRFFFSLFTHSSGSLCGVFDLKRHVFHGLVPHSLTNLYEFFMNLSYLFHALWFSIQKEGGRNLFWNSLCS